MPLDFGDYYREHDETCKVLWVGFGIIGMTLDPRAVTEALGLCPSMAFEAGEDYVSRRGRKGKRPYGLWAISTVREDNPTNMKPEKYWKPQFNRLEPVESTSAEEHCESLLDRLEPVKDVIRTYVEDPECRVAVSVWWESLDVTGGFTLSAGTLSRLSGLCKDLDVFFVSSPEDE